MGTKVKGAALKSRRDFVEESGGSWQAVLDALSAEDRKTLESGVLASAWYPYELNDRLDRAIAKTLGGGEFEVFEEIGRWSAIKNLGGSHKAFLRPGNPAAFLAVAPQIYKFYYDVGTRTYEPTGPNSGVLTTSGAEKTSEADCRTVIGWYREALLMCGASDVEIRETRCRAKSGDVCTYEVSWR